MKDLSFLVDDNKKLNIRVAVLPIKEHKILLTRQENIDYVGLVGGRMKIGESSLQAIMREVKEELGLTLNENDLKLQYISENFFDFSGISYHEILFIYTFDYKEKTDFNEMLIRDKKKEIAAWYDLDKLKNLNIKPEIIKKFYVGKPFEHVIKK